MMKILVLGGSGMWGHQVFLKLSEYFGNSQVACTLKKNRSHYDRIQFFQNKTVFDGLDFRNFDVVYNLLGQYKPSWVINCVGLTPRKYDPKDEAHYFSINADLPHKLNNWCEINHSKLIHFSTDCVFTGKKGEYTESDIPDATDIYGKTKALGEVRSKSALTYRLSKIGREIEGKTEILEWALSQKGREINGFSKAIYSGVTTNFMAAELIRIIEKYPDLSGLFQVAGPKINKFELLKIINQVYECRLTIHEKIDYAVDKSLNCELYKQTTGFNQKDWLNMIMTMKKEERIDYDSFK
jgi:dTDP-4-dehydrorhamnose reductase